MEIIPEILEEDRAYSAKEFAEIFKLPWEDDWDIEYLDDLSTVLNDLFFMTCDHSIAFGLASCLYGPIARDFSREVLEQIWGAFCHWIKSLLCHEYSSLGENSKAGGCFVYLARNLINSVNGWFYNLYILTSPGNSGEVSIIPRFLKLGKNKLLGLSDSELLDLEKTIRGLAHQPLTLDLRELYPNETETIEKSRAIVSGGFGATEQLVVLLEAHLSGLGGISFETAKAIFS